MPSVYHSWLRRNRSWLMLQILAKVSNFFSPKSMHTPFHLLHTSAANSEAVMMRGEDIGGIREQLQGIAMLLLSFAWMADRVCLAPRPVRASVMSFLRPAEMVALEFVAGEMPAHAFIRPGDDVPDAARLAVSFRALALALAGMAAEMATLGPDCDEPRLARLAHDVTGLSNAGPGLASPLAMPFDTS